MILDVTTRCNLDCPVCYRNRSYDKDMPFTILKKLAYSYDNKIISLCGGEPTIRDDLPELIKLFSRKNTVFLVTNGLRLVDYDYLKLLKNCGLKYISFSFNGFSENVYKEINGAPLLGVKLKALQNVKRLKIKTIFSVLIVRGINENEIKDIFNYCIRNMDFIKELRIRSMAHIGKYLIHEKYTIPELLDLVCNQININKQDVHKENELNSMLNQLMTEAFIPRDCSLDFHLKKLGDKLVPLGSILDIENIKNSNFINFSLLLTVLRMYGIKMVTSGFLKIVVKRNFPWVHDFNIFKIGLRSWPSEMGASLIQACRTGYYMDGEILPFCYANLLRKAQSNKY